MIPTHCPYCALQCATTLHPVARPGAVEVRPRGQGGLCRKGWTAAEVLTVPDRLTTPLIRDGAGDLVETSWDAALDFVAERIRTLQAAHGRDAVAVFGGGGLTNEKAYALGKFARVALKTANVDYNGRFCMSSAAAATNRSFGIDRGLPFPLADLGGADAVLLVGSNIAETMPPAVAHLQSARDSGGLLVVDPRRSATAGLTSDAGGIHLQATPGTDLALVLALTHVVVQEGLADTTYLRDRTDDPDLLIRSTASWWPERAERVTGVPAATIRRAARVLAAAAPVHGGRGLFILTGRGAEQHSKGTDTVTACINLALALGLPGRLGSGYGCITGQGNGQGGREHGQKADQLPGYRSISDPTAREHLMRVWGVDELPGPGKSAVELINALGTSDGPKALLVHGSNLLVSAPNLASVRERLASLDLLVVADVVPSETALLADVVFPVTQWAEEDGTMTSLEGRVLRRRAAVPPPGEVRSDLAVFAGLAERLGSKGFSTDPAEVFEELRRASAGGRADYSGITWDRLDAGEVLFWPVPSEGHPGTPRLFADGFPTADGRAHVVAVDHRPVADDLNAEAPLYLVTGRLLQHYQSGAQTRRVPELAEAEPEVFAEIHPRVAAQLGIGDGRPVRLRTARGSMVLPARVTADVRPDTVFVPFHFGGAEAVNELTNDVLDPVSGMPEFKACAVEVTAAALPATGVSA
ncbi:assimilatory nitrate reductase (NADH) alpha subunit apoprotein [Kribbella kalugense]|uniref:Assimilatory nitrate reductase (NADH) alpha subunit apoprotein n=1 Tax=Kribbella kalugense TaxID=2512221 RepID=A0A4R7ZJG1_9ACTN|nr:molybdopterin oxidoreductase family protein [Kribbella kalugense]TDW15240.1 assimilatory nitrate reductase (NADH) alpha subunit apoprotein [Kribbella kalugense]